MVQYAETQHAFDNGISSLSPEKGVELIEKWEDALKDVDGPAAKAIGKDLGQLKKAISGKSPDAGEIKSLLNKLGGATSDVAEEADGAASDKLKALGKSLSAKSV